MKPRVFISQWMPKIDIEILSECCHVDHYDGTDPLSKDDFIARAKHANALLVFMCDTIDRDIIKACPDLRVVSSFGKGYDNIDIKACSERNILVTINPDTLTDSTADLAIGLLLSASRNILSGDRHVRKGPFKGWHPAHLLGKEFHHSKLGIIGFGAIGQAIARRAKGFDVDVMYYDVKRLPDIEKSLGVRYNNLSVLLSQSDFIAVAVDLNPQSYHLIGQKELEQAKEGAVLVNVCRGSVVDESAVNDALNSGNLGGYAADVFEFEDRLIENRPQFISDSLLNLQDKTVFTPHIGTGTVEARERLAVSSANQLIAALRGQIPTGAVNHVRPERFI